MLVQMDCQCLQCPQFQLDSGVLFGKMVLWMMTLLMVQFSGFPLPIPSNQLEKRVFFNSMDNKVAYIGQIKQVMQPTSRNCHTVC